MSRFNFPSGICFGGDGTENITFEWVGRVLSQWEALEFEISRLFAALMNDPDGRVMQFYGTGKTILERTNFVRIALDHHFMKRPHQEYEGDADALLEDVTIAADRRNEVAHGIVFNIALLQALHAALGQSVPPAKERFVIVPPYYADKRHSGGLPKYAYSSEELRKLRTEIMETQRRVRLMRHRLFPDLWQSERTAP